MAWTDAQIASAVANLRESAATLNEVAQILRTQAVRMDNLVNSQLPQIRNDIDQVRTTSHLTSTRLDYLANSMGIAVKADVHAIRGAVAGFDANEPTDRPDDESTVNQPEAQ